MPTFYQTATYFLTQKSLKRENKRDQAISARPHFLWSATATVNTCPV